jgi:anti-sigma factor RsiW
MSGPAPAGGCDMVLLVQAEFDGELDAAQAARLVAHRQHCPICTAAGETLARTRAMLRERPDELYEPMPADLRRRLMAHLEQARPAAVKPSGSRLRLWWSAGAGFGLGAACAAMIALLVLGPLGAPDLTQELVASHIRALQPGHLEDVVSTDRHTVKPWFDGRVDFAPPVKDLAAQGFPLKGGRLDYVGGQPVAALVYQRDRHIVDLYAWPQPGASAGAPTTAERDGYNVVHWNANDMSLWAVSDVEASQLRDFVREWQHLR